MHKLKPPFFILFFAFMLYLAWPPTGVTAFAMVAFVPLFFLRQKLIQENKKGFLIYAYLGVLLWNILCTWWVAYITLPGAIAMFIINSAYLWLPFLVFQKVDRIFGEKRAFIAFISFWVFLEFIHYRWDLAFPWLTLGNSLSAYPEIIQWYEWTGVLGGSTWLLIINYLVYNAMNLPKKSKWYIIGAAILLPILISYVLLKTRSYQSEEELNALILQPNIDPFHEKFEEAAYFKHIKQFKNQLEPKLSNETDLIVMPETALVEFFNEKEAESSYSINALQQFIKPFGNVHIVSGAETYNLVDKAIRPRGFINYNTALSMDKSGVKQFYHKAKLVPGSEKMPYLEYLPFLRHFFVNLGGISGQLGYDKESKVMPITDKTTVAPLICYESLFGSYASTYLDKEANLLLVMTNDGWWKNTDGYKHHLNYAKIQAISHRKQVLRSANTGISAHIDEFGRLLQKTNWWEKDVIECKAKSINHQTFYSKSGDYLGKIGGFISLFLILGAAIQSFLKKRNSVIDLTLNKK